MIPGYSENLSDNEFNEGACNNGICSQEGGGYYYNGYNWYTSVQFSDNPDIFVDVPSYYNGEYDFGEPFIDGDEIWTDGEDFIDMGDGTWSPAESFTDALNKLSIDVDQN